MRIKKLKLYLEHSFNPYLVFAISSTPAGQSAWLVLVLPPWQESQVSPCLDRVYFCGSPYRVDNIYQAYGPRIV